MHTTEQSQLNLFLTHLLPKLKQVRSITAAYLSAVERPIYGYKWTIRVLMNHFDWHEAHDIQELFDTFTEEHRCTSSFELCLRSQSEVDLTGELLEVFVR